MEISTAIGLNFSHMGDKYKALLEQKAELDH